MGKLHFSKLLIFALIIAVSFAYVPYAQAGGIASAITNVVSTIVTIGNFIINAPLAITEIVVGSIPGLGIVGEDGKCRLMNLENTPAKLYYDECGGGGGSSSGGGGSCSGSASPTCSSYSDQQTVSVSAYASGQTGEWWCDNHFGGNLGGTWDCISVSGGSCPCDVPANSSVACGRCGGGGGW